MPVKVNQIWLDRHLNNFVELDKAGGVYQVNSDFSAATKKLCLSLAERGISYKAINLGGGVTRITNNVNICPKCKGTGKC